MVGRILGAVGLVLAFVSFVEDWIPGLWQCLLAVAFGILVGWDLKDRWEATQTKGPDPDPAQGAVKFHVWGFTTKAGAGPRPPRGYASGNHRALYLNNSTV